jgi:putative ABC transport system permease protein
MARSATRRPAGPARARPGGGRVQAAPSAVWLKAPLLLLRFPGALVAMLGASAILALATAAGPLFLSSAGTSALRTQVGATSSVFAGLTVKAQGPIAPDRLAFRERLLRQGVRGLPALGPRAFTLLGASPVDLTGPTGKTLQVRMASRPGFVPHIRPVQRAPGPGWWLADRIATLLHVEAGDTVTAVSESRTGISSGSYRIRIAGVYVDLLGEDPTSYWRPIYDFIYPTAPGADPPIPPPLLLTELPTLMGQEATLADEGIFQWEFPLTDRPVTLSDASTLASGFTRLESRMSDPVSTLGNAFTEHITGLSSLVARAQSTQGALTGSVNAVSFAGRLVALLVFAVAGVYAVHRRRVEFTALQARGMGPFRLGLKLIIETILPAAVGAGLGYVAAVQIVRILGPTPAIAPEAVRGALVLTVVAAAAGIALAGGVAGVAARSLVSASGRRFGRTRRIPWEVAALALAAAAFYEIQSRGTPALQTQEMAPKIDLLLPLFPILFVAGAGGLVVRGLTMLLPRMRAGGRRRSDPVYLATRRLSAAPRVAVLLVTASVLAVGVLSYAGVLVSTVRRTVGEKARVFIGSDEAITVGAREALPAAVRSVATRAVRIPGATVSPGQAQVALLGVDPSTFQAGAFWDPALAGDRIDELLGRLRAERGGRVPVLIVAGSMPARASLDLAGFAVPVEVVGTAEGFPGMVGGSALVVASADVLNGALEKKNYTLDDFGPTYQIWVRGPTAPVIEALRRQGVIPSLVQTAAEVEGSPGFLALRWTFGFLEALGVLAGLVALVGLVLYLAARQGAREVSYALAKRMGLSRGSHRTSVALELGAMLAAAFVLGSILATVAAALIYGKVDLLPQIPPGPLLEVPRALFGLIAGTLVVFAWVGAWGVQRKADRANIAEVMRLAG